jgi:hypothetical protein
VSEGGLTHIKSNSKVLWLLFIKNFEQNIQKAIHPIGMKPSGISEHGYSIISPVQDTVTVNQYNLTQLIKSSILPPPSIYSKGLAS